MIPILSPGGLTLLDQYAWSNVLVGFDFDGTLAPIVTDPRKASLRASTRSLLRTLADRYPCAVISGRSRGDVARRLRDTGIARVLGNHGLEPSIAPARVTARVRAWRRILDHRLGDLPGVALEDKTYSLSVHYRRSRTKKLARRAIQSAVAELAGVRLIPGKQVVNLVPEGAGHKGVALLRERDRAGCTSAIFVGDDDTDEDVFALDSTAHVLSIRIGRKRGSLAEAYLPRQSDIDALIRRLVHTRKRPRTEPTG